MRTFYRRRLGEMAYVKFECGAILSCVEVISRIYIV